MSDGKIFGFDVECRDTAVAMLIEMTNEQADRERLLDTLRMMIVDQRDMFERICQERAKADPVTTGLLALLGKPHDPLLVHAQQTAAFLADVLIRACQRTDATQPARLQ
jgi:hypothetical protein